MKSYRFELESTHPYSQSRPHEAPKLERELPDAYARRTWQEFLHTDEGGFVYCPSTSIKNALAECAKFFSMQIPGKGKSTYTKHFEAGIFVNDHMPLYGRDGQPIHKDSKQVEVDRLFLNSDGKRGSGSRVWKYYPTIKYWTGTAEIFVLDEIITEDVLTDHFINAGRMIGIGRFRPRQNGYYGRFEVKSVNGKSIKHKSAGGEDETKPSRSKARGARESVAA